ncbi:MULTISPECIES: hypothetical protein [unclassified Sphingomonas]|uniref:EF-hand domain-containing protein n=1 Tax=unclassified Sphingomonas TaxID=196159 RepID=UPI0022699ADF|nr:MULTISPECIES: hypothetical protein [unclassified Sphingomonas]
MRKTILTLALAVGGLAAAAGNAQSSDTGPDAVRPPRGGPMMRADANGDGVITHAEAIADAEARFAAMDSNKDGRITPDERQAAREAMRAHFRERAGADGDAPPPPPRGMGSGDRDGDREITRADYIKRAAERFDRMDANHDGRLDSGELARMRPMRGPRGGGDMPPPPPAPADAG